MLSAAQLRDRWKSPEGEARVRLLRNVLRGKANITDFSARLIGFNGAEEVTPELDLRGIDLARLVVMQSLDLSGAQFDAAKLSGGFGGSKLARAVFDEASGSNVDFGTCDLQGSSFVQAKLPGAVFFRANLEDADLSHIAMHSGQLREANCRRTKFIGADLRMVWAAEADIRGADFSGANLVGASLGLVKWDSSTKFTNAQLSFEGTPEDLQAHALAQGASLRSEKPEWELSLFDATMQALLAEESGEMKVVLESMSQMRASVERDPDFPWADFLQQQITKDGWETFQKVVRKAASNMGAFLSLDVERP